MKKLIMMVATLMMWFAISLRAMGAPRAEGEYYNMRTGKETYHEET